MPPFYKSQTEHLVEELQIFPVQISSLTYPFQYQGYLDHLKWDFSCSLTFYLQTSPLPHLPFLNHNIFILPPILFPPSQRMKCSKCTFFFPFYFSIYPSCIICHCCWGIFNLSLSTALFFQHKNMPTSPITIRFLKRPLTYPVTSFSYHPNFPTCIITVFSNCSSHIPIQFILYLFQPDFSWKPHRNLSFQYLFFIQHIYITTYHKPGIMLGKWMLILIIQSLLSRSNLMKIIYISQHNHLWFLCRSIWNSWLTLLKDIPSLAFYGALLVLLLQHPLLTFVNSFSDSINVGFH